jgi:hypothetical protein
MRCRLSNRKSNAETLRTRFFSELFAKCSGADDREQQWRKAIAHVGGGLEPMRFPVYECLFLINTQSQKLLNLLEETS